jgi:hypothetical protein
MPEIALAAARRVVYLFSHTITLRNESPAITSPLRSTARLNTTAKSRPCQGHWQGDATMGAPPESAGSRPGSLAACEAAGPRMWASCGARPVTGPSLPSQEVCLLPVHGRQCSYCSAGCHLACCELRVTVRRCNGTAVPIMMLKPQGPSRATLKSNLLRLKGSPAFSYTMIYF